MKGREGTRPGDVSADRNRRRLGKADDELVAWFRSNVGVKAQGYEPGHAFDSNEAHASRLRSMRWLMGGSGAREWYDRVAVTVAMMPPVERRVLELVYTPHGWPTWLADALNPPWGGGTFVALAAMQGRAAEAAKTDDPAAVYAWLSDLGRGSHGSLFRKLNEDCEALRIPALGLYEVLRQSREKQEAQQSRAAKLEREARNAALYEAEVGRKRRRAAERFEARVRRAS